MIAHQILTSIDLLTAKRLDGAFPPRKKESHKGLFGHILIIGGDFGMAGSVRLAGEAALRIGAGLVTIATRREHLFLNSQCPPLLVYGIDQAQQLQPLIDRANVLVLGPGLGQSSWSKSLFDYVFPSHLPMILDADGLNWLAKYESISLPHTCIYTPHPGEAARLLHSHPDMIQTNRIEIIQLLCQRWGGIAVLKGANTLISDGQHVAQCQAGNPGMATAGMGDVLAGIIASLVGQHWSLFDAACFGVLIHACAGDLAAKHGGERGLLAHDLFPFLRQLVNNPCFS